MKENIVPFIYIGLGEVMCNGYDASSDDGMSVVLLELFNKHSQDVLVDIACYSPEGVDVFIGWLQTAKERLTGKGEKK